MIKYWDNKFSPSYTPMEMLDLGVFEGIYTGAIKGIPSKYKNHKNNISDTSKPDININKYKVKSRQSLSQWKRNGWLTNDSPLGWWEWYIKYFEGRRIEDEDKLQIGRWNSFVARHQGQINANKDSNQIDKWLKSKQGLLQWGWNWETKYTPEQLNKNLNKIAKITNCSIKENTDMQSIIMPNFLNWN